MFRSIEKIECYLRHRATKPSKQTLVPLATAKHTNKVAA